VSRASGAACAPRAPAAATERAEDMLLSTTNLSSKDVGVVLVRYLESSSSWKWEWHLVLSPGQDSSDIVVLVGPNANID